MVMNSYMLIYDPLCEVVAYASFVYAICFRNYTGYRRKMLQCRRTFFILADELLFLSSFRVFD